MEITAVTVEFILSPPSEASSKGLALLAAPGSKTAEP